MVIRSTAMLYTHAVAAGCVYWGMSALPWMVPMLQTVTSLCSLYIGLVYLDRLFLLILLGFGRLTGWTDPKRLYKFLPLNHNDPSTYPKVLVQLPMCNEKEVPGAHPDRVRVVEGKGVNVKYVTRANRKGYKAGNLANGLAQADAQECQFIALFDADFEPPPDFLERTIPFFVHNPQLGAVMGIWAFRNENECLISKFQAIFYANYFNLQHPVGSTFSGYANFYGSGGVWRIAAIQEAGGWQSRVLVEDVDMSISAALKGWKSLCLEDLYSRSELPRAYKGFRLQCNRIANGVMNVVKMNLSDVLKSKVLPLGTKYFIAVSLFNFMLYENFAGLLYSCLVVPVVLLFPDIQVFKILLVAPFLIHTIRILITNPRAVHLSLSWVLFENVRQVIRAKDSALAFFGVTTKWIVTKKGVGEQSSKEDARATDLFILELLIALYMFICASLAASKVAGDKKS